MQSVLIDGIMTPTAAEGTKRTHASVTQAVQLIFNEVMASFKSVNLDRSDRPGFAILTVELPDLAVLGLVAGLAASDGLALKEKRHV